MPTPSMLPRCETRRPAPVASGISVCSRPARSTFGKVHMSNRPGRASMLREYEPIFKRAAQHGRRRHGRMTWYCSFVADMSGERAYPKKWPNEPEKFHHYTVTLLHERSCIEPSEPTMLPCTIYANCSRLDIPFSQGCVRLGPCSLHAFAQFASAHDHIDRWYTP
jgi:hypothetical protein